jgi:hypothetical protein
VGGSARFLFLFSKKKMGIIFLGWGIESILNMGINEIL